MSRWHGSSRQLTVRATPCPVKHLRHRPKSDSAYRPSTRKRTHMARYRVLCQVRVSSSGAKGDGNDTVASDRTDRTNLW